MLGGFVGIWRQSNGSRAEHSCSNAFKDLERRVRILLNEWFDGGSGAPKVHDEAL